LAFGATLSWLVLITCKLNLREKICHIGIVLAFSAIMLLSFSRGGVITFFLTACGTIFSAYISASNAKTSRSKIALLVLITIICVALVWHFLTGYTEGALYARYFQGSASTRLDILAGEVRLWLANPLLGVGPGAASKTGELLYEQTHTEFTRLLAEHGLFGVVANALLLIGAVGNYKHANSLGKIWISALTIFAVMYFFQAATRTVAPIISYGMIWLTFLAPED
jgi:O-antigen ligase